MYWNGTTKDHKDLMNVLRQAISGYGEITYPITYVGTGDGGVDHVASPPPGVSEVWTLICTTGGGNGVGIFSVTGSVSGAQAAATVGVFYESAGGEVEFLIEDGPADYVVTDQFDITVTQNALTVLSQEWAVNRWSPPLNDVEMSVMDFPNNAMNGSTTVYASRVATTGTLYFRLDDATEFDQYGVQARNSGFSSANTPTDWTFEWSDDGINWTVADTQVGQIFTAGSIQSYSIGTPGRHFHWRLNITAVNGGTNINIAQLRTRIPGSNNRNASAEESLMVEGQGLAGSDNIHCSMQMAENILSPYFNWALGGAVAYDDDTTALNQPSGLTTRPYYVSNDAPMEYWIFATGRYFSITTKIATDYTNMYMGLLLPYSQPAEYSYPLIIMGNSYNVRHYTSTATQFRQCFDPGGTTPPLTGAHLLNPGGTWDWLLNWITTPHNERGTWPYFSSIDGGVTTWLNQISDSPDGTYMLAPIIPIDLQRVSGTQRAGHDHNAFGEIHDVFQISGSNNSAENIITVNGDEYICFQNIFRTTFKDFYCMKITP